MKLGLKTKIADFAATPVSKSDTPIKEDMFSSTDMTPDSRAKAAIRPGPGHYLHDRQTPVN
jgi:hypothetical protein